ncbi:MAG: ATP-binding protein [Humidesulfovibrio sp.]|nr:ATP-binding protein [Humidesulfovibrio sp.]
MKCRKCKTPAEVALPSHNTAFCRDCFSVYFTGQVEKAIRRHGLINPGERVLVALSGGKDSLGLMLELSRLGYDVTGLHVDLGIPKSSSAARAKVEGFCAAHGLTLRVVELEKEGLPIPDVKRYINRPVCSACGKIKRHWFNRVALEEGFEVLATGHNLDDEVARLFANTLRWDAGYLSDQGPCLNAESGFARKIKPLYRLSEFETACYAFLNGIEIHTAPCPYSGGASFTGHKRLWADLEYKSPGSKIAFYDGFLKRGRPAFAQVEKETGAPLAPCEKCGSPTSTGLCGVCRLAIAVSERRAADPDRD